MALRTRYRYRWLLVGLVMSLSLESSVGFAQTVSAASLPRTAPEESKPDTPDLWNKNTLLGDWGGLRPLLDNYGITFTLNQTSDYVGNTQGGMRQGFIYDGLLNLDVDVDLSKSLGWRGGRFHISGYGIQGQDLSTNYIGNMMTATNVESQPSIAKLGEIWLEQRLLDERIGIRGGLLEADRYYMISPTAGVFINSTFGFPDAWEVTMPGGGPGYPNATPGALLTFQPTAAWTLTASIMNGSPIGPNTSSTRYGTEFPVGDGVLSWAETAFTPHLQLGTKTLPGTYKVGGWYNSARVDNVTLVESGRTFTNPINQNYRGQYALYGLLDQALWRESDTENQGLNSFFRVTYNPQQNRNLVTWYFDTGLAYTGLFDGRPEDVIGLGFAWAKITPYLSGPIAAENTLAGTQTPMPTAESLIELTYQAPISPWLSLQPFFQYAMSPAGKAPMPSNPNQAIPNATVVGVRANISF